jgi:hypothetical protein
VLRVFCFRIVRNFEDYYWPVLTVGPFGSVWSLGSATFPYLAVVAYRRLAAYNRPGPAARQHAVTAAKPGILFPASVDSPVTGDLSIEA